MMGFLDILKSEGTQRHSLSKWMQAITFVFVLGIITHQEYQGKLDSVTLLTLIGIVFANDKIGKKLNIDKDLTEQSMGKPPSE